jgi:para-nitrobenzyl esterase
MVFKMKLQISFIILCFSLQASEVVAVSQGLLRGSQEGNTWAYKNVPFAAAPVGELRWRAPQPAPAWSGTRDATQWGSVCPQLDGEGNATGNEDCLQLNVWQPASASTDQPLAVMVWIHGGAFVQGGAPAENSGTRIYDGRRLAEKTGNIVVTVNYRLGPLGWLAHPSLASDSDGAGNYGTLDQIAALRWVRDNIAAFGGDSNRVMIFGESAGGASVCSLIASPLANGLFQSAAIQSGGCVARPLEQAEAAGQQLAEKAGCAGAEDAGACLRALDLDTLLHAMPLNVDIGAGKFGPYGSVVDGVVLPEAPLPAIEAGHHNQVPVIIGSNSDETSRSVPLIRTNAEYIAAVHKLFPQPALAAAVLAVYPAADYPSPRAAYVALTSDPTFICGARRNARALHANQPQPVWRYNLSHAPDNASPVMRALGAWHGIDVLYLFGTFDALEGYVPGDGDRAVSDAMADYWGRLARVGYVNADDSFHWNEYRRDDITLQLEAPLDRQVDFRQRQCNFWEIFSLALR